MTDSSQLLCIDSIILKYLFSECLISEISLQDLNCTSIILQLVGMWFITNYF